MAKGDYRNKATKQKQERQEALREYLSNRGKLDYIFDNIEKMEKEGASMEQAELQAISKATDTRVKLLNKYIPDLKSVDIEGGIEHSGSLSISWQS